MKGIKAGDRRLLATVADMEPDPRNFEEQMRDLGVEVKKPDGLKNINWITTRGRAAPLTNKISINKNSISFGKETVKYLNEENNGDKLQFGVAEYQDKKVLVIKTNKSGYKKVQNKRGYVRAGSPALIKMIQAQGLPLGIFRVKKAKGGIVCIPERNMQ